MRTFINTQLKDCNLIGQSGIFQSQRDCASKATAGALRTPLLTMPAKSKSKKTPPGKTVATLRHDAKRKNLPTVEYQAVMRDEEKSPIRVAYERRNRDLDPQFVWRGKDDQDWS